MKKGEIVEGVIERIQFPNKGIMSVEDTKVIVKNTIPGQKVSCRITKKKKGRAEANVLEILEKAPDEIDSPCPHFGICGGCNYQNLPYEAQLFIKENQVKQILDEVYISQNQEPSYMFEGIKPSPVRYGYRNKMEFSFGDAYKDGPLSLGMHKRGSFYDIVTVDQCQIVDPDFRKVLSAVLTWGQENDTPFYHRMRQTGYLRHLLVRRAVKTGELMVALVTTTLGTYDLQPLVNELCKLDLTGKLVGVLHTYNDSVADVVKNDKTEILYGQDYFYEELLGLRFKITEFSFFQTNSLGAEVLYETARSYIGSLNENGEKDKIVFDLYSGTGTIAQLMAPVAKKVIGVEIIEEAVEAAKKNAELNGLHNCEFIAGDVLKVLDTIEEKPDLIILDPPRDGIHPKALTKIIDYGVDRIVYISCKPTSLARDLAVFEASGYKMEKAVAVDMFPGTVHVETVCLLSKLHEAKHHVNVKLDMDEMDLTAAESKATYAEIKDYVLKEHGLKVSNLYISHVKRKYGIEVGENYNLPKSEESKQPQCPVEKEKVIKDALEHLGMIRI